MPEEGTSIALEIAALADLERLLERFQGVASLGGEPRQRLQLMKWLTTTLGNPQRAYPHVQVGGTSGKGSVATRTAAILSAHGWNIGLHVSPYVQSLNESWQINGRNGRPSLLLRVAEGLCAECEEVGWPYGLPSYFQFKVALAFAFFKDLRVDAAVFEVGLGGMWDSTNVLDSGVKVLTNVGLDHTEILGETVEEIARDKIGIFRPGSRVVSAVVQPNVRRIVQTRCAEIGAPLWLIDDNLHVRRDTDRTISVDLDGEPGPSLQVPFRAGYEDVNIALAVAGATSLLGHPVDPDLTSRAIAGVKLPARLEVFTDTGATTVLDGAHNSDKIAASIGSLRQQYPGRDLIGVVALKSGKDAQAVIAQLAGAFTALVFTTFQAPPWRCIPPSELAQMVELNASLRATVVEIDPLAAVRRAQELAGDGGVVVVIGSFYLAGNVRRIWVSDEVSTIWGGSYSL